MNLEKYCTEYIQNLGDVDRIYGAEVRRVPVSMIKNLIKEKYFFLVVQVARTKAFFGFFKPFDLTYMLFGHGFSKTDLDIQASH